VRITDMPALEDVVKCRVYMQPPPRKLPLRTEHNLSSDYLLSPPASHQSKTPLTSHAQNTLISSGFSAATAHRAIDFRSPLHGPVLVYPMGCFSVSPSLLSTPHQVTNLSGVLPSDASNVQTYGPMLMSVSHDESKMVPVPRASSFQTTQENRSTFPSANSFSSQPATFTLKGGRLLDGCRSWRLQEDACMHANYPTERAVQIVRDTHSIQSYELSNLYALRVEFTIGSTDSSAPQYAFTWDFTSLLDDAVKSLPETLAVFLRNSLRQIMNGVGGRNCQGSFL
jgi:hypothetical protein